jgi:protein-L-isoaspartate(D-aspartate) O-methyltransferase
MDHTTMRLRRREPARVFRRAVLGVLVLAPLALATDTWEADRQRMVADIQADVRATREYIGKGRLNEAILEVIGRVPRHEFVPEEFRAAAYANRPLPIGYGQTISQPYIVALMTDLLEPGPEDRVLEVGTGSGYQAAVLSALVGRVYTMEIVPELGQSAAARLKRLDCANVETRVGDGYYGWPEAGPFDGIMVTAVAGHIPPPLIQQLKPGGRMVIPVGQPFGVQQLVRVTKDAQGGLATQQVLPVRFVPLTGDH